MFLEPQLALSVRQLLRDQEASGADLLRDLQGGLQLLWQALCAVGRCQGSATGGEILQVRAKY